MTVLYLTNNPRLAGTARILLSWLRLGRQAGVEGVVAAQESGELTDWMRIQGVPVSVTPMCPPARSWPFPGLTRAWKLSRWARVRRVSIVHCNEHDVFPFGVLVARILGVPVVCHVRFAVTRDYCHWAFGGWRRPDALLWTTNQQRLDCAEAIRGIVDDQQQHLIPLGPDLSVFESSRTDRAAARERFDVRSGEVVIGTATALRPVKRLHDFVDLIGDLAEVHPNVVGRIAGGAIPGEEAYRTEVEQRIEARGLGRRLRWLGHLEPVEPFLRSLDIFVSTSAYETFGNSVCEAMACGLPVAAYVGGSVHEVVGNAGIVVATGDLPALREAVGKLVVNPDARRHYGGLGQDRVRREFNPATSFRRLREIYDRLEASSVR